MFVVPFPWSFLVAYLLAFAAIMAPAAVAGRWLRSRLKFAPDLTALAGMTIVSLAGYLLVWLYFLRPVLGILSSIALLLCAAAALAVALARAIRARKLSPGPFVLAFFVGLLYLAILYLHGDIGARVRFFAVRPADNLLPRFFAEHLFTGTGLRDTIYGYLGSDRPPLQSGLTLIVRPLAVVLGVPDTFYQCSATVVQLAWVFAYWSLCVRAGLDGRMRAIACLLAISSGFFLYNSVYTWPKLIAAALCVAFALFLNDGLRARSPAQIVLAAVAGAGAYLAHGGAAFFLLPIGLVLTLRGFAQNRSALIAAVIAGIVLLAPWSLYQRYYDPPGDRLLLMHLGGIMDPVPQSALAAIAERYGRASLRTILIDKATNLQTAFIGGAIGDAASSGEDLGAVNQWRIAEREFVFPALAWTNLGWLLIIWFLATRRSLIASVLGWPLRYIAAATASLVFWSLITFGPNETVVTHSAYAVDLLLIAALACVIARGPRIVAGAIVGAQCADFIVVWIMGSAGDAARVSTHVNLLALALLAVATLGICATLALIAGRRDRDDDHPERDEQRDARAGGSSPVEVW